MSGFLKPEHLVWVNGYALELCDPLLAEKIESWTLEQRTANMELGNILMSELKKGQKATASLALMRAFLKMPNAKAPMVAQGPVCFKALLCEWKECAAEICTAIYREGGPLPAWLPQCILQLGGEYGYFECLYSDALAALPQFYMPLEMKLHTNAGLLAFAEAVCTGRVGQEYAQFISRKSGTILCTPDQIAQEYPQLHLFMSAGKEVARKNKMAAMLYMGVPRANAEVFLQNFYQKRSLWQAYRDLKEQVDAVWNEAHRVTDNRLAELEVFVQPLFQLGDFVYRAAVDLWLLLHDLGLPPYVIDEILRYSRHSINAFITKESRRIRCCQGVFDSARAIREKNAALALEHSEETMQAIQLSKRQRIGGE